MARQMAFAAAVTEAVGDRALSLRHIVLVSLILNHLLYFLDN